MAHDPAVLNDGLHLAMAWGDDWLRPIQARLAQQHPTLAAGELDRCDAVCREAMRFGHAQVLPLAPLGESERIAAWKEQLLARYPWINEANLSRLYSQGMYYAMK